MHWVLLWAESEGCNSWRQWQICVSKGVKAFKGMCSIWEFQSGDSRPQRCTPPSPFYYPTFHSNQIENRLYFSTVNTFYVQYGSCLITHWNMARTPKMDNRMGTEWVLVELNWMYKFSVLWLICIQNAGTLRVIDWFLAKLGKEICCRGIRWFRCMSVMGFLNQLWVCWVLWGWKFCNALIHVYSKGRWIKTSYSVLYEMVSRN